MLSEPGWLCCVIKLSLVVLCFEFQEKMEGNNFSKLVTVPVALKESTQVATEEPSHFEHEGGSESEAEGLKDQGLEEDGGLEDQGSYSPVQSGDESVREVQNECQEAGEEI
ncbi:hypothetical protein DY000_02007765 [Brassica cretica]|uniref:Uncharacterized protein n=1 Tax=Brassica cretica TaxID=69181 RepID=A0ABQ7C1Y8_BRACR|nr:hypothetical protein DY000_02007765 [Brassica cretica]